MSADEESIIVIRLAQHDLTAARILYEKEGPASITCFHAQQTVEKSVRQY